MKVKPPHPVKHDKQTAVRTEKAPERLLLRPERFLRDAGATGAKAYVRQLALFLAYCEVTESIGDRKLQLPEFRWHHINAEFNIRMLHSIIWTCADNDYSEGFTTLRTFCEKTEEKNEILRGTLTLLLRYIPQDAEMYNELFQWLMLLRNYLDEPRKHSESSAFLKECLLLPVSTDPGITVQETPESVCSLFRALLPAEKREAQTFYDPCCGTGRLIAAMTSNNNNGVHGMDLSPANEALFTIRNLLSGNIYSRFFSGNTVTTPLGFGGGELQTFDVVVCHPPFGYNAEGTEQLAQDEYRRFERGLPRRNSGDWLHICNCLAHTKREGGIAMVLATKATLFREDVSRDIRRHITEENLLDAVIALPPVLQPVTGIAPVLLIFRHGRSRAGVRFINAEDLSSELGSPDIERIRRAYESNEEEPGFARTVPAEEIEAQQHCWSHSRYLSVAERPEDIKTEELQAEIRLLRTDIAAKQARLTELLRQL